jgi:hypothetical protein
MQQGGLLRPMLFNIMEDMLAILIARAKEDGHTRKYTFTKWNIIFYLSGGFRY